MSQETFSVGEIAILNVPARRGPELRSPKGVTHIKNGDEVTVLSACDTRLVRTMAGVVPLWSHRISHNGTTYAVPPEWLKKKRLPPPREDVGSWAECPWQPAKVVA